LTLTRLDLNFQSTMCVSFYMHQLLIFWTVVKHILRYVKHTLRYGVKITKSSSMLASAFSDSNWAGDPDDRRSTGGFAMFIGGNLVSWCARKQPTISRSSTEAE
jgi:hypothetical protein